MINIRDAVKAAIRQNNWTRTISGSDMIDACMVSLMWSETITEGITISHETVATVMRKSGTQEFCVKFRNRGATVSAYVYGVGNKMKLDTVSIDCRNVKRRVQAKKAIKAAIGKQFYMKGVIVIG